MLNVLNRSNTILSARFEGNQINAPICIENGNGERLARIPVGRENTIREAFLRNPNFSKAVDSKVSKFYFTSESREDAKIQEVTKVIFSLANTLVTKEYIAEPECFLCTEEFIVVSPINSLALERLAKIKRIFYSDRYQSKDWFREVSRFIDVTLDNTPRSSAVKIPEACSKYRSRAVYSKRPVETVLAQRNLENPIRRSLPKQGSDSSLDSNSSDKTVRIH